MKFFLLCACLVSCQVLAGAILTTETREWHVSPPAMGSTKMFADGGSLRVEITSVSSGEDGLLIYNGHRNELLVADNERLEYYVIDKESMNRMAAQVSEVMKQMEEMLKTLPPDQRAAAEEEMKQQMPALRAAPEAPGTIQKTGGSENINGYDCEHYKVIKGEKTVREMCVAKWDDIEGGPEAVDAMIGIGGFFEAMHDAFASGAGTDFMGRQQEVFAQMKELGGYPVYAKDYDETGMVKTDSILRSSQSETIDPAMFRSPEGYRRVELN